MTIRITFEGEVQFAAYTDSSRGGPRIALRLHDRAELEKFVGLEGKRFMCVLVAIADDEQPEPPRAAAPAPAPPAAKLGPLALSAVQMCANPRFQAWLGVDTAEAAGDYLKDVCQVASRRDLDTDEEAGRRFRTEVMARWAQFNRERAEA